MAGTNLDGWEVSVLFLLFMGISCVWQVFIAIITFFNSFYGDGKRIWLNRLKEEVLDVGVISLALAFLHPYIANICVSAGDEPATSPSASSPSSASFPPSTSSAPGRRLLTADAAPLPLRRLLAGGGSSSPCPPGRRHLFPGDTISTAHYLLFFVALVHIVYSVFINMLTLQRFATWAGWERRQRKLEMDGAEALAELPRPPPKGPGAALRRCCGPRALACWRGLMGGVDRGRYMVLRGLFQLRAQAYGATAFGSHNLHYSMVCENAMQIDIENVVAHGWLQALIVAVFTLYTTEIYQIVWIGGISIVVQSVVVLKLRSVLATVQRIMEVEVHRSGDVYRINTRCRAYQDMHVAAPAADSGSGSGDEEKEGVGAVAGGARVWGSGGGGGGGGSSGRLGLGSSGGGRSSRKALASRSAAATVTAGRQAGGAGSTLALSTASGGAAWRNGSLPHGIGAAYAAPQPQSCVIRDTGPLAEGREKAVKAAPLPPPWAQAAAAAAEAGPDAYQRGWDAREVAGVLAAPMTSLRPWQWTPATAATVATAALPPPTGWSPRPWLPPLATAAGATASAGAGTAWDAGTQGTGAALAALTEGGGRMDVWGPGPVAEAKDWSFGGGGGSSGGGGGGGALGVARGRSDRLAAANGTGRTASDGGGKGGNGKAAAGGVFSGIKAAAAVGGAGGSGGRINILARGGGAERGVELSSRSSGGAAPSAGRGGGARAGRRTARSASASYEPAVTAAAVLEVNGTTPGADRDRGGGGDGGDAKPPPPQAFLSGFTFGSCNPLYDMDQHNAGTQELSGKRRSGGGGGGDGHVRLAPPAPSCFDWFGDVPTAGNGAGGGASDGRSGDPPGSGCSGNGGDAEAAAAAASEPHTAGHDITSGVRVFNPLFVERSPASTSFSAAGARAAAAAEPPADTKLSLRAAPSFGWSPPLPPNAVAAPPPSAAVAAGTAAKRNLLGLLSLKSRPHLVSSASSALAAVRRELELEQGDKESPGGRRRRNTYGGGGDDEQPPGEAALASASEVLLPAAAAERRRLVKVNPLYLDQPHLPILDVPPPPSNTGVLPPLSIPNMASPRAAAAAAGYTVLAAAAALNGGPVLWLTAAATLPPAAEGLLSPLTVMGGNPAAAVLSSAVHALNGDGGATEVAAAERRRATADTGCQAVATTAAAATVPSRATADAGCQIAPLTAVAAPALAILPRGLTREAACQTLPPPPPPLPPLQAVSEVSAAAATPAPLAALFKPYTAAEAEDDEYGDCGAGSASDGGGGGVDHDHHAHMAEVERKLQGLFWWRRPQLLLWATSVNYLQNSLSMTLCLYYMGSYGTSSSIVQARSRLLHVWVPLLAANLGLMLYIGWVVVPLYTLVTTTTSRNPRALQEHIRAHKRAEEEEGGIAGLIVDQCTRCFKRSHHEAARHHHHHGHRVHGHGGGKRHGRGVPGHGPGAPGGGSCGPDPLNALFLVNLANQAGVLVAAEGQRAAARLGSTGAVYTEFLLIWWSKARVAGGVAPPPGGRCTLQADVSEFRLAFWSLDGDGSGSVSAEELSTHLLLLAGTRVSRAELRAMVAEIDYDGDGQVDFAEFLVFMVFCFLDMDGNGCVEERDLLQASRRVRMRLPRGDVLAMVDMADPDGDRKVGLRQFSNLFQDVDLPELGTRPTAAQDAHGHPGQGHGGSGGRGGPAAAAAAWSLRQPATHGAAAAAASAAGGRPGSTGVEASGGGTANDNAGGAGEGTAAAAAREARVAAYRQLRVTIPNSPI